ncbi:MAG: heavy-metal-associated domain-containing protein [Paludibacter sp.]|nr:heavy-metal-associated domain-containing protein [Paludibacter sp.]
MEKSNIKIYQIGGMSCGGCAAAIKQKLATVSGVTSVNINLGKKQAEITSSQIIKADTLQMALSNTQYTISELRV